MKRLLSSLFLFIVALIFFAVPQIQAYLLVGSGNPDSILRYDDTTGEFLDAFVTDGSGGLDDPFGFAFGPDGNFYVSSRYTDNVLRYNGTTGEFIDVFASAGSAGLNQPHGLTFGPDGNFYVVSSHTHRVLRYDGTTGAFIDIFASGGGLSYPTALIFGPDGNLYVSSSFNNLVLRYDGTTGAFIDIFASGGGLSNAQGLAFGPDGNLYVGSYNTSSVLRYDGTTGAFIDIFASGGGLVLTVGVVFGPDGNLYAAGTASRNVVRYDGTTGEFIDVFVPAGSGGLNGHHYMLFTEDFEQPDFDDVPPGYWAEEFIHKIYEAGITSGCSQNPLLYCPEDPVTRAQMAVFLERGINGSDYSPPGATGVFDDCPVSHWAADWIEQFYADGITSGCSTNPLMYCPDDLVTRAQMAVFLLRSMYGSGYTPPSAAGIFDDVPVTHWAANWIEALYDEGISGGCSTDPPLYCPDEIVNRAQMAVFIVRAFDL